MLFWKEMKKIICSIPYLLFVAAVAIGLYSQGVFHFQDDLLSEPQPGGNYGVKQAEIPEIIMPAALQDLWMEFCENDYVTYPIGFIKHVKLDEKEKEEMAEILSDITGMDPNSIFHEGNSSNASDSLNISNSDGITMEVGNHMQIQPNGEGAFSVAPEGSSASVAPEEAQQASEKGESGGRQNPSVRSGMDYARFQELMRQADRLLGGGSKYAAESLISYGSVPLTYEEAQMRYSAAVNADHVTGGYARLFSDYAGVMVMSLLPVFLAVVLCLKDQRSKMEPLVYTKKASAAKIIIFRYLALLAAAMLPVFLFSYMSNIPIWDACHGMELDYLAPLKYDLGWILPTVMIAIAIGMFLTELTGAPIAVAVQSLWWLFDTNTGIKSVHAGYALSRLSPRHNAGARSWFQTQAYLDNFQNLLKNRLLLAAISLLLTAVTILLYEAKRKGKFHGNLSFKKMFSSFGNRKNEPKA